MSWRFEQVIIQRQQTLQRQTRKHNAQTSLYNDWLLQLACGKTTKQSRRPIRRKEIVLKAKENSEHSQARENAGDQATIGLVLHLIG